MRRTLPFHRIPGIFGSVMRMCLLMLVLPLVSPFAPVAGQDPDTTDTGGSSLYSETQARRGETAYARHCRSCHLPEFFSGTFIASWAGAPVGMLFDLVSTTMPQDRPASLPRPAYADILAYIFELNGLPAGRRELPSDPEQLARLIIQGRP